MTSPTTIGPWTQPADTAWVSTDGRDTMLTSVFAPAAIANGLVVGLLIGPVRGLLPIAATVRTATIEIVANGLTFQPLGDIASGARILWTFDVGGPAETTSTVGNPPVQTYATAVPRTHRLEVTPSSAIIGLNFGYAADDAGPSMPPAALWSQQDLTAITGLVDLAAMTYFCCSANDELHALSFTNCPALTWIEAYGCYQMSSMQYSACAGVIRICAEQCHLTVLSGLSDMLHLMDFRNRGGFLATYAFGSNPLTELFHFCVGSSTYLRTFGLPYYLPALQELLLWSCHFLTDVTLSLDAPLLFEILAADCPFIDIDAAHMPLLRIIDAQRNALSSGGQDTLLQDLVGRTVNGGNITAVDNPHGPSTTDGDPDIATLVAPPRNWTILHQTSEASPVPPQGMSNANITWGSQVTSFHGHAVADLYNFVATYNFAIAAELNDWVGVDPLTVLAPGAGSMLIAGGPAFRMARWKQQAIITRVYVYCRLTALGAQDIHVLSDLPANWDASSEPYPGCGVSFGGDGNARSIQEGASTVWYAMSGPPLASSWYNIQLDVTDTALSTTMDLGNSPAPLTVSRVNQLSRCLAVGGNQTNLEIGQIVITGMVVRW